MHKRLTILVVIFIILLGYNLYSNPLYRFNQNSAIGKLYNKIHNSKRVQDFELKVDKYSFRPSKYSVRLSDPEIEFLKSNIKKSSSYLEYGAGGSTYIVLLNSKAKVDSVESDEAWLDYMREWKYIRANERKRLKFLSIDIGKIGEWGIPVDKSKNNNYPEYSKKIYENGCSYDVVFIDGRFRTACALQTILNCSQNTKILIHDFTIRPYYHEILKFADVAKETDTMVLFRIKENIDKKTSKECITNTNTTGDNPII